VSLPFTNMWRNACWCPAGLPEWTRDTLSDISQTATSSLDMDFSREADGSGIQLMARSPSQANSTFSTPNQVLEVLRPHLDDPEKPASEGMRTTVPLTLPLTQFARLAYHVYEDLSAFPRRPVLTCRRSAVSSYRRRLLPHH